MKGSDKPICGVTTKQTGEPCQRVAGWGTPTDNGPCKYHKGTSPDGSSHERNQNATTHSLYAVPDYLKEHFSESQEDRYTAYFEALCSRYERYHGEEPDDFAKDRLSRVAIECVKERIADEYLSQKADGNLLVEKRTVATDAGPVEIESENKILKELTALKRETRLTLKDMGLLRSPEQQAAENVEKTLDVLLSED